MTSTADRRKGQRRVLGVDPGLTVTGFAVVDGDGGTTATAITHGVYRSRAKDPRAQRLAAIYDRLCALIEEYRPDDLAIEQHFVHENVRSALVIGEARASAMIAAARNGLQVYEYPATVIKQTVTGYGGAAKEQVQRMVVMHLGLNEAPQPLDASDALAAALTRLAALRMERMVTHSEASR